MFTESKKQEKQNSIQDLTNHFKLGNLKYRFPRIFTSLIDEKTTAINGLLLMLPNRTFLPLLGISSAGLIIPTTGILGQIKIGQILDCKLKFSLGLEPMPLKLRVMRLTARSVLLVLEGSIVESRIKLEQVVKDHIIFSNIRNQSTQSLPKTFHDAIWWSAPFDTNFLSWSSAEGQLTKAIIEYDGLIFIFENHLGTPEWYLKKSTACVDELRGYAAPWIENENQKITMGASWKQRLIRLIEQSQYTNELQIFRLLLRAKMDV